MSLNFFQRCVQQLCEEDVEGVGDEDVLSASRQSTSHHR